MIMRYFGGGIGHRNNTARQQAHRSDPLDLNSNEMAVEDDEEDDPGADSRNWLQDVIMHDGELEVGENDEEDNDGAGEDGDDSDNYDYDDGGDSDKEGEDYNEYDEQGNGEDGESVCGSDGEEGDCFGYASL